MLKHISLGIYYPGNSLLHRLQARTKLLIFIWLAVCFIVANHRMWHFTPYIVGLALFMLAVVLSGISPRQIWQRMWLLVLFGFIGALSSLLFSQGSSDQPLYTFGPVLISYALLHWILLFYLILGGITILLSWFPLPAFQNFWRSRWPKRLRVLLIVLFLAAVLLFLLTRTISPAQTFPLGPFVLTMNGTWLLVTLFFVFLVIYALTLLLTMTTPPIALIEGMTLLLTPLRKLRLPVDDFALMMLIALRFIPTLFEEMDQLIKAQTARGADFAHGTLRERVQSLSMLFIPFMQGTLRRAADLATALEARGYESEGPHTLLHEGPLRRIDYTVLGTVLLVTVGALVI